MPNENPRQIKIKKKMINLRVRLDSATAEVLARSVSLCHLGLVLFSEGALHEFSKWHRHYARGSQRMFHLERPCLVLMVRVAVH